MSRIKISSGDKGKIIIVEYEEILVKKLIEREMYKENVPNKVFYPDLEGNLIERSVLNNWFDKDKNDFMYKLDSGFLIVSENELSKFNVIDW